MRLHKFVVKGRKVFILEEGTKKPSGNISLNDIGDWKGYAQGENSNVIIKGLENPAVFSKEDVAKRTPEMEAKKASIAEELDKMANEFEIQGCPDIALALDKVSDQLDPSKE